MRRRAISLSRSSSWFTLLLITALVALVACNGDTKGVPKGWGPVQLGKDTLCPPMQGRYVYTPEPIGWQLAGRHVPWDSVPAELEYFAVAGSADSALHVTVGYVDGRTHEQRLQKGTPYSRDYHCEDGWLHISAGEISNRFDAEVASVGFYAQRHAMRIARSRSGALVARLDRIDYDEFYVWCGDGCKGFPLPWTFETRSTWSQAKRWIAGTPRPSVVRREREEARLKADPVYQENQRLENGEPVAGQPEARRRVSAALVPGMLLRAVAPRDSGWHLSLEFEELSQLAQFMERLSQSGPVAELKVLPLYRAKTTNGHWIDVVYVRYEQ
jgi:hypothetical protein